MVPKSLFSPHTSTFGFNHGTTCSTSNSTKLCIGFNFWNLPHHPPPASGKGIGGMVLSLAEVLGSNGTILPFEGARAHLWRVVVRASAVLKKVALGR